jgi:hypothetical protein
MRRIKHSSRLAHLREVRKIAASLAAMALFATGLSSPAAIANQGLGPQARTPKQKGRLQARLWCDRVEISPRDTLPCAVFLLADPAGGPIIIPRQLLPYLVKGRPPTVITFEATDSLGATILEPSFEATHGRNHPAPGVQEQGLMVLLDGNLFGWYYDLNGADWVFPSKPGTYQLRARLRIDLTERDEHGKTYEAVALLAGSLRERLKDVAANGEWETNAVSVIVRPNR